MEADVEAWCLWFHHTVSGYCSGVPPQITKYFLLLALWELLDNSSRQNVETYGNWFHHQKLFSELDKGVSASVGGGIYLTILIKPHTQREDV